VQVRGVLREPFTVIQFSLKNVQSKWKVQNIHYKRLLMKFLMLKSKKRRFMTEVFILDYWDHETAKKEKFIKISHNIECMYDVSYPTVDVILPFHRIDENLSLAVKSVLCSEEVIVRLILVDDRDQEALLLDQKLAIPKRFTNYILLKNKKNGYASAINLGLSKVASEFVALMNSDDLVSKERLKLQIKNITRTGSDICIANLQKFGIKGFVPSISGKIDASMYSSKLLLLGAYGADASILFRSSIASEIVFYEGAKSADWITALRTYPKFVLSGEKDAIYYYRIHENQVTSQSTYNDDNFFQVYPFWKEYNSQLGLPYLEFESAMLIAAIHEYKPTSVVDYKKIKSWTEKYLSLFENQQEKKVAMQLIKRRIVISKLKDFRISGNLRIVAIVLIDIMLTKIRNNSPRGR
jgi:glycosyltransferase involved in cell wall biosynthesis